MMSIFGIFAVKTAPFRWSRFIAFMLGLVAIVAVSIAGEQRIANRDTIVAGAATGDASASAGEAAAIVRFPQPMEDTYGDLRQIGLPWFLRRQGATATLDLTGGADITVAVSYQGKLVGSYVERLGALGQDRSKLLVAFTPRDMALVNRLAAPIDTKLDPVTLMRVVMAEHIRSTINGGGFDMNVLTETPGSRKSVFRKAFADSGKCENPQVDDFPECSNERENANIRRAYREEAAR